MNFLFKSQLNSDFSAQNLVLKLKGNLFLNGGQPMFDKIVVKMEKKPASLPCGCEKMPDNSNSRWPWEVEKWVGGALLSTHSVGGPWSSVLRLGDQRNVYLIERSVCRIQLPKPF